MLKFQVKLNYEVDTGSLYVTIAEARALTYRSNMQPRNAYVKLYFLPDRRYISVERYHFTLKKDKDLLNKIFIWATSFMIRINGKSIMYQNYRFYYQRYFLTLVQCAEELASLV